MRAAVLRWCLCLLLFGSAQAMGAQDNSTNTNKCIPSFAGQYHHLLGWNVSTGGICGSPENGSYYRQGPSGKISFGQYANALGLGYANGDGGMFGYRVHAVWLDLHSNHPDYSQDAPSWGLQLEGTLFFGQLVVGYFQLENQDNARTEDVLAIGFGIGM